MVDRHQSRLSELFYELLRTSNSCTMIDGKFVRGPLTIPNRAIDFGYTSEHLEEEEGGRRAAHSECNADVHFVPRQYERPERYNGNKHGGKRKCHVEEHRVDSSCNQN